MKFRGTPTYGGGSYYKLIGSVHAGAPAQPGDARIENGGNAKRDRLLLAADKQRVPGKVVSSVVRGVAFDECDPDPKAYAQLATTQERRPDDRANPAPTGATAERPGAEG